MTRYTFAVCSTCGVQSPMILLAGDATDTNILSKTYTELEGWKFHDMKFSICATCPKCASNEEAA